MTTPKELAAMPGVKVKALEWTEYETEGWADRADAEAGAFGVFYNIDIQKDGYRVVFDHEAVGAIGTFDTADEAKAAAQADYEARILSALEATPPAPYDPLPDAYQTLKDGKWVECSQFVAMGWGDTIADGCRPLYVHPPSPAPETAGVVLERFSSAELQGYTGLLREDPEGDWVRYEDAVAALAAANKRADTNADHARLANLNREAADKARAANLARAEQAEARVAALVADLGLIDALDPESRIDGFSPDALRGLVIRMGAIARHAIATSKQNGGGDGP